MSERLAVGIDAAKTAGEMLKEHFGKITTIERKADHSLVTDLDKRSDKMIVETIRASFPNDKIISEESGNFSGSDDYKWVIDPIDGTHNFIRGISLFGVSIGLIYKNQFTAGVIYLPCSDELYTAELGSGAFKNGNKISVSDCSSIDDCTLVFDSGMRRGAQEKLKVFSKIAPKVFNVRMFGVSVRNLTYLAEGKVDLLMEFDDHLWDYAAGVLLVMEAGGVVTDFCGKELTPECRSYMASNRIIHNKLFEFLPKDIGE